jgi:hypothetical protein
METPELDPGRDLAFPVFDAATEAFGPAAWGGWVETHGEVVGVSRVRGGVPDDFEGAEPRPGVTVWSFAPNGLAGDVRWPAHQAVLAFARRFAEEQGSPWWEATERLMRLVDFGGEPITVRAGANSVAGQLFEIEGLGWMVSSAGSGHALAATFFLGPAILEFERVTDLTAA